jgi:hypothetical protein
MHDQNAKENLIALTFRQSKSGAMWERLVQQLGSSTVGAAFVSPDCSVLAKCKNFTASAQDISSWFGLFNDLSQCRQRGLSYGGKILFVTEFNEGLIVARRDQNVVILVKAPNCIIAAVCDSSTPPVAAYKSCQTVLEGLRK